MRLEFVDHEVIDSGIALHFTCADPGPAKETEIFVVVSDEEMTGDASTDLETVRGKLARRLKGEGVSSLLDGLIKSEVELDRKLSLESYEVVDDGVVLGFVSLDPPAGQPSDYSVKISEKDLTGDPKADALVVQAALERKLKPSVFSEKLLALAGWSVEI